MAKQTVCDICNKVLGERYGETVVPVSIRLNAPLDGKYHFECCSPKCGHAVLMRAGAFVVTEAPRRKHFWSR